MARPRRSDVTEDEGSPDPLGYSGDVNTLVPRSRRPTPIRKSTTLSLLGRPSPQKTVIIEPEVNSGPSPYRIRVTVQAEPRHDVAQPSASSPLRKAGRNTRNRARPTAKSSKVKLQDADDDDNTTTTKRGGKRTRSGTPAPKKRQSTARRSVTNRTEEGLYQAESTPINPALPGRPPPKPRSVSKALEAPDTLVVKPSGAEQSSGSSHIDARLDQASANRPNSTSRHTSPDTSDSPQPQFNRGPSDNGQLTAHAVSPSRPVTARSLSPLPSAKTLTLHGPAATSDTAGQQHAIPPSQLINHLDSDLVSVSVSGSGSDSDFDPESADDVDMLDLAPTMGEETMMKSMDMTIVSPASLYSKIDLQASMLHPTPARSRHALHPLPSNTPSTHTSKYEIPSHPAQDENAAHLVYASLDKSSMLHPAADSSIRPPPSPAHPHLPTPETDAQMEDEIGPASCHASDSQAIAGQPKSTSSESSQHHSPGQHDHVITHPSKPVSYTIVDLGEDDESDFTELSQTQSSLLANRLESEPDFDIWQQAGTCTTHSLEDSRQSGRNTVASYLASRRDDSDLTRSGHISTVSQESQRRLSTRPNYHYPSMVNNDTSQPCLSEQNDPVARIFQALGQPDRSIQSRELENHGATTAHDSPEPSHDRLALGRTDPQWRTRNTMSEKLQALPKLQSPPLVLPHSPRRSSPLKHNLDCGHHEQSSMTTDASMASHARQLHNGLEATKRPAHSAKESDRKPQSYSPRRHPQKSLLRITQVRKAQAAMMTAPDSTQFSDTCFDYSSLLGSTSLANHTAPSIHDTLTTHDTGKSVAQQTIHRVLSFVLPASNRTQTKHCPPRHPSHRLVANLHALPSQHPWTDNHFQSILSLYKHWLTHELDFLPTHHDNASLLCPRWQQYIDMEFSNWGYDLKLCASLVVLAALFEQLLILQGEGEFEARYGIPMKLGFVANRTRLHGPITEWHIVLRLFTVVVGDIVRADEANGMHIDRTPALKWRFSGQWFWRRGWCAGLL